MRSGLPRHYNLINRQAGRPLYLPSPSQSGPAFLLPVPAVLGRLDWTQGKILNSDYALRLSVNVQLTPPLYNDLYKMEGRER